jgi:hypothetical protein
MRVLGPEYEAQMMPWLKYIATERMLYDPATNNGAVMVRQFMSNMTFAKLAFNTMATLKHTGVGLSHLVTEIGDPVAIGKATVDLFGQGPRGDYWRKFVKSNSGEVRGILWNTEQNIGEALASDVITGGKLAAWHEIGFSMFSITKSVEAQITWLAKYRLEIAKGTIHPQAVAIADKAVRDTQGASSVVDAPAFLRRGRDFGGESWRAMAGFAMGFRNTAPNRIFTMERQFKQMFRAMGRGDWADAFLQGKDASGKLFGFVIFSALWVGILAVFAKDEYDKHKSFLDNMSGAVGKEMAWEVAGQTLGSYTGLSGTFQTLQFGREQGTMVQEEVLDAMRLKSSHNAAIDALTLIAGMYGIGTDSLGLAAKTVVNQATDAYPAKDRGAVQAARQIIVGHTPKQPRHRMGHRIH